MEISLKFQDDINSTLKRWDDVKNGRMPQPFISSFFNKKEDDNNNMNIGNNNNNQNKGGFDLLGFGNEFGGNNNGNNNSNK